MISETGFGILSSFSRCLKSSEISSTFSFEFRDQNTLSLLSFLRNRVQEFKQTTLVFRTGLEQLFPEKQNWNSSFLCC